MGRLMEVVQKALRGREIAFSVKDSSPHVVTFHLRYSGNNYYVIFHEFEDLEVLLMLVSAPILIPPERRIMVSQFITRVNGRFKLGTLTLDFEDGDMAFRLGYDLEGIELPEKTVMNMIYCGLQTLDHFLPAVMRICFGGKTDVEALKELDENRLGLEVRLAVDESAPGTTHEGDT